MRHDLLILAKVFAVAIAVGLDVFAISVGVGVMQLAWRASLRVGLSFSFSEIAMQLIGYGLGTGVGGMLGELATAVGLVLLAFIGITMIRGSFQIGAESKFDVSRGHGLILTALSLSLDSLGVGIALPTVGIPLLPLMIVVSITTTSFTLVGLSFGARLGERYEKGAELAAGIMLVLLAVVFGVERLA